MSWSEVRETYGRELVNLRNEGRYTFLNTLFSVSEAVLYMQVGPHSEAGIAQATTTKQRLSLSCKHQQGLRTTPDKSGLIAWQ